MKRTLAPLVGLLLLVAATLVVSQWYYPAPVAAENSGGNPAIKNPIDKFILQRLETEKIQSSPICTDEEFARRIYVDICGIIPTSTQLKMFMADRSADKREKLIDNLLKSPRYAEAWSVMWSDLLREHSNSKPREGTEKGSYREWIRESLATNKPYDQFARELITAGGNPDENGAVNFYLRDEQNRVETANTVSTVFMGTRMACAQCHDHPFDKWTQQDFHSVMSFFGRVNVVPDPVTTLLKLEGDQKRLPDEAKKLLEPYFKQAHEAEQQIKLKASTLNSGDKADGGGAMGMAMGGQMEMAMLGKGKNMLNEIDKGASKETALAIKKALQQHQSRQVMERPNGDYHMPADGDGAKKKGQNGGEIVPAIFPWDSTKKSEGPGSRRKALADFVTGSRQFASVQVNRLWAETMGHGIVDPIDDFREKNPPSHPELLDYLTDEFIKAKFDNQHILRLIFNSSTYQRSTIPTSSNRSDAALYSHMKLRRMTAEETFDSILVATGHDNGLEGMNINVRELAQKAKYIDKKQEVQWAADLPTPARTGTFMNLFNQPNREQTAVKRDDTGSISQALELMNGRTINDAIKNSPMAATLLTTKASPQQVIVELYLSTLSRQPSNAELNFLGSTMKGGTVTREWIDDTYWALLNSREFTFIK
jgi:hypothetical protein